MPGATEPTSTTATLAPMTAEDFARRPDPGVPEELVEGRVEAMTPPRPYHGYVCGEVAAAIRAFVREHELGYVLTNDSGVITARDPDTVRGADVCYYSHAKVPKGTLPRDRYLDVSPDLVAEVLSPEDRWPRVLRKVVEYLTVGVGVVLVVDAERRTVHVYEGEEPVRIVESGQTLRLPTLFGDRFTVEVASFFD